MSWTRSSRGLSKRRERSKVLYLEFIFCHYLLNVGDLVHVRALHGHHVVAGGNAPGRTTPGDADPERVASLPTEAPLTFDPYRVASIRAARFPGALPPATYLIPFGDSVPLLGGAGGEGVRIS